MVVLHDKLINNCNLDLNTHMILTLNNILHRFLKIPKWFSNHVIYAYETASVFRISIIICVLAQM